MVCESARRCEVKEKLARGQYETGEDFWTEIRLIWLNCAKFNYADQPDHANDPAYPPEIRVGG